MDPIIMPRVRGDHDEGDVTIGSPVLKVSALMEFFEAYDAAEADGADVALKKKAVKDAVVAKGWMQDAFTTVQKLRNKPIAYAQAWLEAVNIMAEAAGLNQPIEIEHDVVHEPGTTAH
jgi:hypothetical protein